MTFTWGGSSLTSSSFLSTSTSVAVTACLLLVVSVAGSCYSNYNNQKSFNNNKGHAAGSAAAADLPIHPLGSVAREIQEHLRTTQTPAVALGIVVDEYQGQRQQHEPDGTKNNNIPKSLTLSAPLEGVNTNVHGTAFAGSLYSVAVLASYYLGRQYLLEYESNREQQQQQEPKYTLVAKAGSIQYKRPVTVPHRIVAQSVLPSQATLEQFQTQLEQTGKAVMAIPGNIIISPVKDENYDSTDPCMSKEEIVVACEYSIDVCAYDPKRRRTTPKSPNAS